MAVAAVAAETSSQPIFDAIQRNDAAAVKQLLEGGAGANIKDKDGTPALMAATLFADTGCIKLLLDHGANVNATSSTGATALLWAVPDLAKVKLLLDRGANANARSVSLGRTALLIAAGYPGSIPVLRLLLDKGADLRATDRAGDHALAHAARTADVEVVRFLVSRGIEVNEPGAGGTTALSRAIARRYAPTTEFLLAKGATVPKNILTAATHLDPKLLARLLDLGADVNARTASFGRTPLIHAVSSEEDTSETIELLLARGADPQLTDNDGETALDWAMHRSERPRIELLSKVTAKAGDTPRDTTYPKPQGVADVRPSLALSAALLLPAASPVFARRGCISCHQQSMTAQVAAAVRERGIAVDEELARKNLRQMIASYRPKAEEAMQGVQPGGAELTVGYIAMALAAEKHPLDKIAAALTHTVAARQMPDGSWPETGSRPPMEYSTVSRTVMSVRTLVLYPIPARRNEISARMEKARAWLRAVRPTSAEEAAMRLMGLAWTRASRDELDRAAREWIAQQRSDGGWAQLPHMGSDAYATGITLYALFEAGVPATHAAYRKGVEYLLRNQYADGSWFVKTRSFPVQPQMDSGYPFGYNQWISAAAASWASLALANTLPLAR